MKIFKIKTFQGTCRIINSSLVRSQLCITTTQRYSNVDALTSKLQCCSKAASTIDHGWSNDNIVATLLKLRRQVRVPNIDAVTSNLQRYANVVSTLDSPCSSTKYCHDNVETATSNSRCLLIVDITTLNLSYLSVTTDLDSGLFMVE